MARTRTLAELRTEVRQRADIEGDPHITDTEITRMVNQSCAALHALLCDMDEGEFFAEVSLTTTAGIETLAINKDSGGTDTNLYKLLHVEARVNGFVRSLTRWTFEQRTLYKNASTWGVTQMPISYRLTHVASTGAPVLYFAPVPDGAYQITISFVKQFADMSADSDTFDGRDGWEEWVVLDAAIKCATKDESDPQVLMAEREQVMQRIIQQMKSPDLDRPARTRDVVSATSFPPFRYQVQS